MTGETLADAPRLALLRAVLPHVAFDGWSERALKAGAADLGMTAAMARALFPGGGTELVALHCRNMDDEMARLLAARGLDTLRVRDRIVAAVRLRLELAGTEREAVRRAVTLLALPGNAGLGARLLYGTVDAIWRAAGDTATDWNFYSKRGLLAAVYGSSVLYWLQDDSEGYEDTWAFLSRRVDDVMRIPKAGTKMRRLFAPFRPAPRPQARRL